jgi:hypothetical protein
MEAIAPQPQKMFQLCNVRFLLTSGGISDPTLKPALSLPTNPQLVLYQVNFALPRYYLVNKWRVLNSEEERFKALSDPTWNPAQEALIVPSDQYEVPPSPGGPPMAQPKCTFIEYRWDKIELRARAVTDCMLVGLDRYHPAWKVTVDDEPATLYKANGMLRAVHIPQGQHTVKFTLSTPGPKFVILTVLGWLAGLCFAVWLAAPLVLGRAGSAATPEADAPAEQPQRRPRKKKSRKR